MAPSCAPAHPSHQHGSISAGSADTAGRLSQSSQSHAPGDTRCFFAGLVLVLVLVDGMAEKRSAAEASDTDSEAAPGGEQAQGAAGAAPSAAGGEWAVDWKAAAETFYQHDSEEGGSVSADDGRACRNNFWKGVRWSPDGRCLLSNSEDRTMRLYELTADGIRSAWVGGGGVGGGEAAEGDGGGEPALKLALEYKEPEQIYDFGWYPCMVSSDPATCCFASTCRDTPIHLWDGWTGELRATYRCGLRLSLTFHCVSLPLLDPPLPARSRAATAQHAGHTPRAID